MAHRKSPLATPAAILDAMGIGASSSTSSWSQYGTRTLRACAMLMQSPYAKHCKAGTTRHRRAMPRPKRYIGVTTPNLCEKFVGLVRRRRQHEPGAIVEGLPFVVVEVRHPARKYIVSIGFVGMRQEALQATGEAPPRCARCAQAPEGPPSPRHRRPWHATEELREPDPRYRG